MGGEVAWVLIGVPGSAGRGAGGLWSGTGGTPVIADRVRVRQWRVRCRGKRVRQWRDAATLDSVSH